MAFTNSVLILILIVPHIHGFCFSSFGRLDKTDVTGRDFPVCEYNGIGFLEGTKIRTTSCIECTCEKGHLHCCGFGINAGTIEPPPNCKILKDGCDAVEVRIDDETLDCKTGERINTTTPITRSNESTSSSKGSSIGIDNMFPTVIKPDSATTGGGNLKEKQAAHVIGLEKHLTSDLNNMFNIQPNKKIGGIPIGLNMVETRQTTSGNGDPFLQSMFGTKTIPLKNQDYQAMMDHAINTIVRNAQNGQQTTLDNLLTDLYLNKLTKKPSNTKTTTVTRVSGDPTPIVSRSSIHPNSLNDVYGQGGSVPDWLLYSMLEGSFV